jgi:hypothetical protein
MTLTTAEIAAVKAEIAADPAAMGYAGKTADQIAALMNEAYELTGATPASAAVDTPIDVMLGMWMAAGLWAWIKWTAQQALAGSAAPVPGSYQTAAVHAVELAEQAAGGGLRVVQTTNASIAQAFNAELSALSAQMQLVMPSMSNVILGTVAAITALATYQPPASITPEPPRVLTVFSGIEGAPTQVTAADITEALA